MEPRFNEMLRDWEIGSLNQGFVISRFFFHLFYCDLILLAEEYHSLYRGLRYTEVRGIEVPLYCIELCLLSIHCSPS